MKDRGEKFVYFFFYNGYVVILDEKVKNKKWFLAV